ncbi:DUF4349 domain-containing protein [Desulfocucumis palustris]|nr:DUF4349 domain-containing protein [Desulfocucumis palustris]
MQCHEIRDLLSAHLDGALEPSEHALVASHLETCSDCSREFDDLRMVVGLLKTMPEISPPADFRVNLRKRLEASAKQSKRKVIMGILTGAGLSSRLAVAASLLVVIGSAAILYGHANQWGHKNDFSINNSLYGGKSIAFLNSDKTKEPGNKDLEISPEVRARDSAAAGETAPDLKAGGESGYKEDSVRIDAGNQPSDNNGSSGEENRLYTMAAPEKTGEPQQEKEVADTPDLLSSPKGKSSSAPAAFRTMLAAQPKIVKEAEVSLAAADTEAAAGKVSGLALSLGGQVEASEDAGVKTLVLKVPVDSYDELMGQLGEMGVQTGKTSENDITENYNNAVSNIRMLESGEGAGSQSGNKDETKAELEENRQLLKGYEDSLQNALIKVKITNKQ